MIKYALLAVVFTNLYCSLVQLKEYMYLL